MIALAVLQTIGVIALLILGANLAVFGPLALRYRKEEKAKFDADVEQALHLAGSRRDER